MVYRPLGYRLVTRSYLRELSNDAVPSNRRKNTHGWNSDRHGASEMFCDEEKREQLQQSDIITRCFIITWCRFLGPASGLVIWKQLEIETIFFDFFYYCSAETRNHFIDEHKKNNWYDLFYLETNFSGSTSSVLQCHNTWISHSFKSTDSGN